MHFCHSLTNNVYPYEFWPKTYQVIFLFCRQAELGVGECLRRVLWWVSKSQRSQSSNFKVPLEDSASEPNEIESEYQTSCSYLLMY